MKNLLVLVVLLFCINRASAATFYGLPSVLRISALTNSGNIQTATFNSTGAGVVGGSLYLAGAVTVSNNVTVDAAHSITGNGSGLTGVTPTITNFTSYASGSAYTLTGTPAQLTFGGTSPSITLATAGTYMIQSNVGLKYGGSTYANAQTVAFKFRRTNNTAADITSGSRTVEMPFLVAGAAFTGGDVMTLPPVIYTATAGDIIQVFGSLSATPPAGSVTTDSAEIIAIRLY